LNNLGKVGGSDIKESAVREFRIHLADAKSLSDVYEIVKDTVKRSLGRYRVGLMVYLDDLPLQLGAYHPLGSNAIVVNRALLQIVESTSKSRNVINAFTYTILLHEYLHSLGYVEENEVRPLVYKISNESFGENHVASHLARLGPWSVLKGLPLDEVEAPKRVVEIVKDLERENQRYII
jgi:hypothetical protein